MASAQQEPYIGRTCEVCEFGVYEEPENSQEWHVKCDECGAIAMVYEPLPHQYAFHADPHKYKMFAGGYGSGKTTTGCMETVDHILTTPGGRTLIGAETLPQLEQTAMEEFFKVFPEELIIHHNKQKNYLDTSNGHRVIFRPLDDEQKARSLNLTFWWIEEANGVGYEYFVQLQTRLRNNATDFQRGIMTTNPDMNWVKTKVLLVADKIYNSEYHYEQNEDEINKNISVHIGPTHLNTHLPDTYYEDTAAGKPDWWIARYLNGSFENKEGLVIPMYQEAVVDDFDIPRFWERRIGGDFGLNNPTGFASIATDPKDGTSYIYWVHKESQKPVAHHAKILNEHLDTLPHGVIQDMVGDAAGQQRTAGDLKSVFDHYMEYNIYWTPSTKKLEDSLMKLYGYFDSGKIKLFKSAAKELIQEFQTYKYPERKLDKEVKNEDIFEKPIAVNDHLIDAVRYIVAEFPDNWEDLVNESYNAQNVVINSRLQEQNHLPPELQDNVDEWSYSRSDSWMSY